MAAQKKTALKCLTQQARTGAAGATRARAQTLGRHGPGAPTSGALPTRPPGGEAPEGPRRAEERHPDFDSSATLSH